MARRRFCSSVVATSVTLAWLLGGGSDCPSVATGPPTAYAQTPPATKPMDAEALRGSAATKKRSAETSAPKTEAPPRATAPLDGHQAGDKLIPLQKDDAPRTGTSAATASVVMGGNPKPVTITDDFQTDSRGQYEITGEVKWEQGSLLLGPDARVARKIPPAPVVQLTLDVQVPPPPAQGEATVAEIGFELASGEVLAWVFSQKTDQGKPSAEVRVVKRKPIAPAALWSLFLGKRADAKAAPVRVFPLPDGLPQGRWHFVCRWGCLTLGLNGRTSMSAYSKAETVQRLSWASGSSGMQLHNIALHVEPQEPPTEEQRRRGAEAAQLDRAVTRFYTQGKYCEAVPMAEQCLRLREEILGENHPDYATSLNILGMLYQGMGEYAKAEPLLVQALQIRKKALGVAHPDYAESLNNLAGLYHDMAEYGNAEPLLIQARDVARSALGETHSRYAMTLNNLAGLYESMGDYGKAEPLYLEAREVLKKVVGESHPAYALSLNNVAGLYKSVGEYAKAEPLYVQAGDIWRRVLGETHPHYAASLANLADLYTSMGEYPKAEPLYLQAIDIIKKVQGDMHPHYAASLAGLADLYRYMDEYAKAEPLYLQSLDILKKVQGDMHPGYAGVLLSLAGLYTSMAEYAKAEPLYLQTLEITKNVQGETHPNYADVVDALSLLYESKGDHAKARGLLAEAMRRRLDLADAMLKWQSEAATMAFIEAYPLPLAFLLSISRHLPTSDEAETYEYVWKTRGLIATALAERRRVLADVPQARELYEQLHDVQQQLARWAFLVPPPKQRDLRMARLGELNERKESLESRLAKMSSQFRQTRQVQQATAADLIRRLPVGTAVVQLVQTWDRRPPAAGNGKDTRIAGADLWIAEYDAFVMRPNHDKANAIRWLHLGPAKPIDEAVDLWRAAIDQQHRANASEGAAEHVLRQRLWEPIEAHLAGCSTVIMIPDGRLNFLPWAALPGRRPSTVLLEDYAIALASNGRELYRTLTRMTLSAGGKCALLVGGVAYDTAPKPVAAPTDILALVDVRRSPATERQLQWPFLPGTGQELAAIETLWTGSPKPTHLTGAEASEAALLRLLPRSRYVHLATHGFFADEKFRSLAGHDMQREQLFGGERELRSARRAKATVRNPLLLSGVVLAGANLPPKPATVESQGFEDGILTAEEIVSLDLRNAELVVLSACETGLGMVAGGEGVMGLTRAFHLAGARNVIASLWKVDDNATQALMTEFYRNLWEKKLSTLESLRQAQLTMRRRYDSKHGVLRGEVRPLKPGANEPPAPARPSGEPAPAFFWAGFILSGDGR
jgi:CHAT domain-containing protein